MGRALASRKSGIRSADGIRRDKSWVIALFVAEDGFDHEERLAVGEELAHIGHRKSWSPSNSYGWCRTFHHPNLATYVCMIREQYVQYRDNCVYTAMILRCCHPHSCELS